jgi:glycosyltransferase involved in cell wall biosynthesis
MASERPVVATRVGGNPELVAEGETGCLVPARDPQAMADAIVALLRNPERRKALGQAGRRRAQAVFSLDRMIEQYEALYDEILDRR